METFKDRLQLLMGESKPYAWCKRVGIEKGLFQYYWQMGNIPKYDNLLKIRSFTGCSLDWLMTGAGEAFPNTSEGREAGRVKLEAEINSSIKAYEDAITKLKKQKRELRRVA